jgi:hypothetical protein
MGMFELIDLMASKNGDELFEKAVSILSQFDIEVVDSEGNDKSFYALCCDVAKVMNKEKRVKKLD